MSKIVQPVAAREGKSNLELLHEWLAAFSEEMSEFPTDYRRGYIDGFSRAAAMIHDLRNPEKA